MRVTLRGESSVDLANNSALFVIDGVPMFNTSTSSTSGSDESTFAIDYGDGTSDVNPDDIESITVLKGPAATALYGSNAANGAIIITTKSGGNQDAKLSVSYSTNVMFETLTTSPELQYEYGQGTNSNYYYYLRSGDNAKGLGYHPVPDYTSTVSLESWGPRMDGSLQYQYYDDRLSIGGVKMKMVISRGLRLRSSVAATGSRIISGPLTWSAIHCRFLENQRKELHPRDIQRYPWRHDGSQYRLQQTVCFAQDKQQIVQLDDCRNFHNLQETAVRQYPYVFRLWFYLRHVQPLDLCS